MMPSSYTSGASGVQYLRMMGEKCEVSFCFVCVRKVVAERQDTGWLSASASAGRGRTL